MIRTQTETLAATRAALEAAHLAYMGEPLPARMSDDAARVAVCMALLSATDAAAHLGVPSGCKPTPLTLQERTAIMAKKRTTTPTAVATEYPEGTVAKELASKRKPAPKADTPAPGRRPRIARVRATEGGTSRLQPESIRAGALAAIKKRGAKGITVEELDAAIGTNSRPHIQKLLEKGHVEAL